MALAFRPHEKAIAGVQARAHVGGDGGLSAKEGLLECGAFGVRLCSANHGPPCEGVSSDASNTSCKEPGKWCPSAGLARSCIRAGLRRDASSMSNAPHEEGCKASTCIAGGGEDMFNSG